MSINYGTMYRGKAPICSHCGHEFEPDERRYEGTAVNGNPIFICGDCYRTQCYSTDNSTETGKVVKHGFTTSHELECVVTPEGKASMLAGNYKLLATHDSSLPCGDGFEGVEFKTPIYHNECGKKQLFRSMEKIADFKHPWCGQHINVGHTKYINPDTMDGIRTYRQPLFRPLMMYLMAHPEDTEQVFGRGFTHYANATLDGVHTDFVNLSHDTHIEYRLAKFRTAEQYFILTQMCIEITSVVVDKLIIPTTEPANGVYKNPDECAENAGQRIVDVFKKYANGKATCQRACRNNVKKIDVANVREILDSIDNGASLEDVRAALEGLVK